MRSDYAIPGATLPNGAVIINADHRPDDLAAWYVLAIADAGTRHAQYAVWTLDPTTGNTVWGDYYHADAFLSALDAYRDRLGYPLTLV